MTIISNFMSLTSFFEELFRPSKREIEEKICLWLAKNLTLIEKITGKNFYTAREYYRRRRPFLSAYCGGETFAVLFLTSSARRNQKKVNLGNCGKEGCKDFHFYDEVYLFRTAKGRYEPLFLNRFQIEETATLCGCCENLERIKKYCNQSEEQK